MPRQPLLHEDRLFPADPGVRDIARSLYRHVKDLPIVSPHGHTDPRWYAEDINFPTLPNCFDSDHYVFVCSTARGRPGGSWRSQG